MLKAVIFDMDGVLIDTEKYLVKYWCIAAREAGFDMKPEHGMLIRSLAGKYAGPLLQEIFGEEFDYSKIRARRKELMAAHIREHGVEIKPGAQEILAYLKEKGILTAVATATDEQRAERYLTEIGIRKYFDRVICATMVENGKPEPDVYLYAAGEIGCQPKDCIAVEDSPNGVKSAVSAGIPTIMVPDLTQPDQEIAKIIYKKADSLMDLIPLIKSELEKK